MEKRVKHPYFLFFGGIAFFVALMNLGKVIDFAQEVFALIFPVVLGFVLAFILNVPMSAIDKALERLQQRLKGAGKGKKSLLSSSGRAGLSLLLTLLAAVLIMVLVITMIVPAITSSVVSIYQQLKLRWPEWAAVLAQYDIDTSFVTEWLNAFNISSIKTVLQTVLGGAGAVVSGVLGLAQEGLSAAITFGTALIIAVYALLSKRNLAEGATRMLRALTGEKTAQRLIAVGRLVQQTYARFLSGQCLESCILAGLIFLAFTVFKIPYASLTAILTGILAFIPVVGAFVACFIGAFLVLLTEPGKVILAIAVFFAVQFIENQFIYPHVVGNSVGLDPMWTLIAVLIGGSLLGVFGMVFFIPLAAVFATLLHEAVERRLALQAAKTAAGEEEKIPEQQE